MYIFVKITIINKTITSRLHRGLILLLMKTSYTRSVILQASIYFLAPLKVSLALFSFMLFYLTTCIEMLVGTGQTPCIFLTIFNHLTTSLS
jgi:hypothetical protein